LDNKNVLELILEGFKLILMSIAIIL